MADFEGAGATPGVEMWRIEKLKPTLVEFQPKVKLYQGDAYIVLKTTQSKSALNWDIFFWLGDDSSQDEQGVAAYKAVELDDKLGGAPVQHRETQGHESDMFLQCFKSVTYLKGGVDSAFNKVERDKFETQLLQVKGTRVPRTKQVPLSSKSLNAGDVFILDAGLSIMLWNGTESNRKEKIKGLEVATSIKDEERGGRATIVAMNQGSETPEFWKLLGGKGSVAAAVPDDAPASKVGVAKLFKVSDASGKLETMPIAEGELNREMLDTNDVFLLDNDATIFVWIGKCATKEERTGGMKMATDYLHGWFSGRPQGARVMKVMEGAEPVLFQANFVSWSKGNSAAPQDFSQVGRSPRNSIAGAK